MDKFEARMQLMEKRAKLVRIHQWWTQMIFCMWRRAHDGWSTWEAVEREIKSLLNFLKRHKRSFPNFGDHCIQWNTLHAISTSHASIGL